MVTTPRGRTALLLVDIQNDFASPAPDSVITRRGVNQAAIQAAVDRCDWLAQQARAAGIEVIHVRAHYDDRYLAGPMRAVREKRGHEWVCIEGTWGAEPYQIQAEPGELVVTKHRYSAFHATDLDLYLKANGIDHLVVGGLTTDVCVESTVRDAFFHDVFVTVVTDGCSTPDPASQEASLRIMGRIFADLATAEEVAASWGERVAVERSGSA